LRYRRRTTPGKLC